LLTANDSLLVSLKDTFEEAMKADEQGIANFLSERIDMHQKWAWQLRASTK
jgi:DNA-binding ferritin-like protein